MEACHAGRLREQGPAGRWSGWPGHITGCMRALRLERRDDAVLSLIAAVVVANCVDARPYSMSTAGRAQKAASGKRLSGEQPGTCCTVSGSVDGEVVGEPVDT